VEKRGRKSGKFDGDLVYEDGEEGEEGVY